MKTVSESANEMKQILYNSTSRESTLIYYILGTTRDERESIAQAYGNDLHTGIEKRLNGSFKELVHALFKERAQFDIDELARASKGHAPQEETFFEILFNRPNAQRQSIINGAASKLGQSLETFISTHFHKYTREGMVKMLKMNRCEESRLDRALAEKAAKALAATTCDDWINNDEILNYFGQLTPAELLLMGRLYKEKVGKHILNTIDVIGSKHKQVFFRTLYYVVVNPAEYFAKKINDAVKGLGTDERLLIRVITTRYDVDMSNIKKYYYDQTGETVRQTIYDDCSGTFKRLLIGLVHQLDNNEI